MPGPYPVGWALVRVVLRTARPGVAALTLDVGKGFTPAARYPLGRVGPEPVAHARPLWLPARVDGLCLAPLDPRDAAPLELVEPVAFEPLRDEEGLARALALLDEWMPWMSRRVRERAADARAAHRSGDTGEMVVALGDALRLLDQACASPVGSSRVDLQACKLEYSIVSPK